MSQLVPKLEDDDRNTFEMDVGVRPPEHPADQVSHAQRLTDHLQIIKKKNGRALAQMFVLFEFRREIAR
jgi:hypothetical protein